MVHWNPRQRLGNGKITSHIPRHKRVENFGDLLGPLIVQRILNPTPKRHRMRSRSHTQPRLLSVGSIIHFSRAGDVVWGSGINGKVLPSLTQLRQLDVRCVRGPLTAEKFRDAGVPVPEIYGDPALLIPHLYPHVVQWSKFKQRDVVAVPNKNDFEEWQHLNVEVLNPRSNVWDCIRIIAQSKSVIASSLHALIIADSLGIPTVAVSSPNEPEFKYQDYYNGTDRDCPTLQDNAEDALQVVPQQPQQPITAMKVLDVFPWDLWK